LDNDKKLFHHFWIKPMLMAYEDILKFHLRLQNNLLCNGDLFVFVVVFI